MGPSRKTQEGLGCDPVLVLVFGALCSSSPARVNGRLAQYPDGSGFIGQASFRPRATAPLGLLKLEGLLSSLGLDDLL
jgi:hypothetical protein